MPVLPSLLIGSGINYNKKGLNQLMDMVTGAKVEKIVILYKDRLVRFGYELLETEIGLKYIYRLIEVVGMIIKIVNREKKI